jgi:hypothetical protein
LFWYVSRKKSTESPVGRSGKAPDVAAAYDEEQGEHEMKWILFGAMVAIGFASTPALAQKSCKATVGGESMARMIGEAGGAQKLRNLATAQVKEYDRFLAELQKSRNQGIREAEIEKLRKDAIRAREVNREIAKEAQCYMG